MGGEIDNAVRPEITTSAGAASNRSHLTVGAWDAVNENFIALACDENGVLSVSDSSVTSLASALKTVSGEETLQVSVLDEDGVQLGNTNAFPIGIAQQIINAGTAIVPVSDSVNVQIDLRSVKQNGFLRLKIETLTKVNNGLDTLVVTPTPLARNIADAWVTAINSLGTAIAAVNISTVGNIAYFDITRHFEDNGGVNDFPGEGLNINFAQGAGGNGTVNVKLEIW